MDTSALSVQGLLRRRRSDPEVLQAAVAGDPHAFAEVYRRYGARIRAFCLSKLSDPEAASDATQEVFLHVLRSEAKTIENPSAWLYAIARNVIVDGARAASRRPRIDGRSAGSESAAHTEADSSDHAEAREQARDTFLAVRALPPRYRTVLVMRDIKGLSGAEAARQLGTSPGALDTLLHRARRSLQAEQQALAGLPASCRRAAELLYEPDPGRVTEAQRQALQVHLAGCPDCRARKRTVERRRTLSAWIPFLFPAQQGADAISRLTLAAAHPVAGLAAVGIALALTVVPGALALHGRVLAAQTTGVAAVQEVRARARTAAPAIATASPAAKATRPTVRAATASGPARVPMTPMSGGGDAIAKAHTPMMAPASTPGGGPMSGHGARVPASMSAGSGGGSHPSGPMMGRSAPKSPSTAPGPAPAPSAPAPSMTPHSGSMMGH